MQVEKFYKNMEGDQGWEKVKDNLENRTAHLSTKLEIAAGHCPSNNCTIAVELIRKEPTGSSACEESSPSPQGLTSRSWLQASWCISHHWSLGACCVLSTITFWLYPCSAVLLSLAQSPLKATHR